MDYEKAYKEALERAKAGKPLDEVFSELKESEDERIRTALLRCCDDWEKGQFGCMAKEDVPAIRAYLEKLKEHQNNSDAPNESSYEGTISLSDNGRNLDELVREYIDGVKQYHSTPTWDLMQTAVCYGYHLREEVGSECVESVKPAEWSEEDEVMREAILDTLERVGDYGTIGMQKDWLKSLRPKPKQEWSQEDNEFADDAIACVTR